MLGHGLRRFVHLYISYQFQMLLFLDAMLNERGYLFGNCFDSQLLDGFRFL